MTKPPFEIPLVLQRSGSHVKMTVILDEINLKHAWAKYCQSKRRDRGQPEKLTENTKKALQLWDSMDFNVPAIARRLEISPTTVYRILKNAGRKN